MAVADLRTNWIRHRRKSGFDFADLVEAVSKLLVTRSGNGGLLVDAGALMTSPNQVQKWLLVAVDQDRGLWAHELSGSQAGPLAEWLFTIALLYIESPPPQEG